MENLAFLALTCVYLVTANCCLAMNIRTDQSSLLALKSHITSDPNHILSTNWSSSTSVCDWIGITCSSRHKRVIALRISDTEITGTIPPQLGNLSYLVSLDLSYNNFHGELPPELLHLPKLREIDLGYSNFTGEIPIGITILPSLKLFAMGFNELLNGSNVLSRDNISTLEILDFPGAGLTGDFLSDLCRRLPRLQNLGLGNNMLSGEIPRNISECSQIQVLFLSQNNFVGTIPRELALTGTILDEIGHLYNLESLSMATNKLTGSIPLTIFNVSSLQDLRMTDNKIEGSLPREVENLTMLNVLYLEMNRLEGVIPDEVGNLEQLLDLWLSFHKFSGSIPIGIFNISNLVYISLTGNHISGGLPSTIGHGLPNVQELLLGRNNINGVLPASISNLTKLTYLNLGENELTCPIPESIGKLRFLQKLRLNNNSFTSELTFITPLVNSKQFRLLILSLNPLNAMLPKSISNLSSLEMFYAEGCHLKGYLPNEIRNLRNQYSLKDNDFTGIIPTTVSSLEKLQQLSLGANRISGPFPVALCDLPKVFPKVGNLKAAILLDLSWNQISGNIPSTLGGLQKLIQLSLAHNRIEGSIPETFGKLIDLETLDLSYNNMSGVTFMSNEGLCGNPQKHTPACPSNSKNQSKLKKRRLIWIIVATSVISVIGIASAIVFVLIRRRGKTIKAEDEWSPEVAPQRFSYYELQRATQSFDENNLLGSGSFGSVYKGTLEDGMIVAVKVFNVQMEVPVIHCDLKPSNVLLDNNIVGHLTDFGIAKLLTKEESIGHTTTFATIEYGLEGLISKRSDVYSYGIMLLETFTKKKPNDEMFVGDLNLRSYVHNFTSS
ncbi:probable LRR receptor-like serine/threonine-protein kinase At3g47570 [Solanum dulcamara]|uniref:probable LRR receptor-like serine/threonine-protein kinase At3g47570 n=1 Tax=Solanum dulcamara TaxID=45834 RepID=UPI0024853320|nr:probable LRR receptor-like serine/threonine-protein kinase At3g47570 [Solanum dulcamara]